MTDYSELSRDDLVARLHAAEAKLERYTDLITEYKQMEETLRKRERELSAVFRAVPAGVGLVVQRVFQQANDYFYRALDYRPDEIIGQSTRIVYPSDEAFERINREIQDQIERTGLAVLETQTRCKDGRLIDVLLRVAPLVPNRPELGRVFCALDITEHKRIERELRANETLLRAIMENSPDPIFMADRANRLLYANPAALAVLNAFGRQPPWAPETLVGKTPLDFFDDPALAHAMLESDQRVLESGQVVRAEERIATLGGARIYLSIRSPLRDDAGRIVGLVGIAHDITEQKRSETERFARLERQRDTLVREVHHRIKNHLQGVTGLLRNRIARHPELAQDLEELVTQICAIAHVYGLQSRRAEGGVRLDELLETLAHGAAGSVPICYTSSAPESGAAAVLAPEETVPLALVLNELLTNALKHNDPSGVSHPVRLTLETVGDEQRVVIRNGPAVLPAGFDFAAGQGLGTGLELLHALLPHQGAALTFRQEADEVVTELRLAPPIIELVKNPLDRGSESPCKPLSPH